MKQGSEEWLELRSQHAITWSNAANALGIGYTSRIKYMKQKLGIDPPTESNWRMAEGNRREPWAAECYYRIMSYAGAFIRLDTDGFRTDPQDSRLGGSPDRLVTDLETGEKWLLEIKTQPGADELRDEVPVAHILQMHGLCHTYGLRKAHYFCWCMHRGFLLAEIHFDPQLWTRLYPRYKMFADLWSVRALPAKMSTREKENLLEMIEQMVEVCRIPILERKAQQLIQQGIIQ